MGITGTHGIQNQVATKSFKIFVPTLYEPAMAPPVDTS